MPKKSYEDMRAVIEAINKLAATCPPAAQPICFDLLFHYYVSQEEQKPAVPVPAPTPDAKKDSEKVVTLYKLQGNVKALLRRGALADTDLENLFMLDHEPIMPIYKLTSTKTSEKQLQTVLLILLENAITSGTFKAPYREIRETCKEQGLVDANFASGLRRNNGLFKSAIKADTIAEEEDVELSGQGLDALATLIQQLARVT